MPTITDKRRTFHDLHKSGCFVIPNRGDGAVARRADVVAAVAGGFEPLRAVCLLQSQDSETGTDAALLS
jgi:hypothetical protein